MSTFKDKFRAQTVGVEKKFRSEDVNLKLPEGPMTVKVRQPTVEERGLIIASGGTPDKDGNVKPEIAKLQVNSVIALTVDPVSGEKLFTEADRESLLKAPAGGWFDDLAQAATRQLNVDLADAKNG